MKNKIFKRGFGLLIAAMLFIMAAMPAMATTFTYTPLAVTTDTNNHSTTLEKDLVMPKDANVPNATFKYSIESGTAITDVQANELQVKAGPTGTNAPKIDDVTFSPTSTGAVTDGTESDGITNDATKKYAKKDITVEFAGVEFTEPGVYRYIITELDTPANPGVTNDSQPVKTLDVYVENVDATSGTAESWTYNGTAYTSEVEAQAAADEDGVDYSEIVHNEAVAATPDGLKIAGYVIYDGEVRTAPKKAADQSATAPNNGAEAQGATKDDKYINKYDTVNLTFSKTVTGNQGSRDKYFKFTVTITGATAGTTYTVDLSNADETPHASASTTVTTAANPATLTIPAGATSLTQDFYLHHGQSITIKGLAVGTGYTVSENKEEYTASATVTGDTKTEETLNATTNTLSEGTDITATANGTSMEDTYIKDNTTVALTNNLEGTIPTGVLLSATVGIAIIAIAIIGLVLFARRKRTII